jgi:molybdate transport system permease protein
MKTVVLPTAVFFEAQLGRLSAAVAVSLVMVAVAVAALVLTRVLGLRERS